MSFPMTVIAFDLGYVPVLPFFLGNDIDSCDRRVGVTTLSPPSSTALESLLVVLIFLRVGGGSLLSGKELFSTRHISGRGVGGLILSTGVFLLLFSGLVPSGTPRVNVAGTGGGLEHRLCLRINNFLHSFFPEVQVPASGIHLGLDGRFQVFQEVSDHDHLIWSCTRIQLSENRLQVLQISCPVKDFLLLVLGVPLELSPQRLGSHPGSGKGTP